jgi:N-acylneuraminate cytidylyltransferase
MNSIRSGAKTPGPKTVALIPARGGSKGIARKNVIEFHGHPLLAWTIAAAREAARIDHVYVSTDDGEIRNVALHYGAKVIERPDELSGDAARSESALLHALDIIAAGEAAEPERVVFLQATSPLREPGEIDAALQMFDTEGFDSMFSGASPEDLCLWKLEPDRLDSLNYDYRDRKRRQEADGASTLWIETGSFYITKTTVLKRTGNRLGGRIGIFPVPLWKSYEIDSLDGLELCAWLMHHHKLDQHNPRTRRRP